MHHRLGWATLSQLAYPQGKQRISHERNLNGTIQLFKKKTFHLCFQFGLITFHLCFQSGLIAVELVSEDDHTFRDFMLVAWPTDNRPKEALGTVRLIDDNNKEFVPKYSCYSSQQKSVSGSLS